jgi:glutamine synthetase
MTMQAAMEGEFSLLRQESDGQYTPIDTGLCFSTISMAAAAPVIDDMVAAFEAQGIPVDAYYPELGHGQHELPLRHAPVLRAADNQIWFRETVRSVAANHGLVASLAPKPLPDQAGNGCHIHWSLWDRAGKQNLLYDAADPYQLSPLAQLQLLPPAPAPLLEQRLYRVGAGQPRGGGTRGLGPVG